MPLPGVRLQEMHLNEREQISTCLLHAQLVVQSSQRPGCGGSSSSPHMSNDKCCWIIRDVFPLLCLMHGGPNLLEEMIRGEKILKYFISWNNTTFHQMCAHNML